MGPTRVFPVPTLCCVQPIVQTKQPGFDVANSLVTWKRSSSDTPVTFATTSGVHFWASLKTSSILVDKDKDLLQRAQVFQIVAGLGYTMTPTQIAKEFDFPEPANNNIINKKALNEKRELGHSAEEPKYGFAMHGAVKNKNTKTDPLPADQFEVFTPPAKHEEEIKQAVDALLKEVNSYEEAFDRLKEIFPHFKIESLEKSLERAITNSMILGGVNEE